MNQEATKGANSHKMNINGNYKAVWRENVKREIKRLMTLFPCPNQTSVSTK